MCNKRLSFKLGFSKGGGGAIKLKINVEERWRDLVLE